MSERSREDVWPEAISSRAPQRSPSLHHSPRHHHRHVVVGGVDEREREETGFPSQSLAVSLLSSSLPLSLTFYEI